MRINDVLCLCMRDLNDSYFMRKFCSNILWDWKACSLCSLGVSSWKVSHFLLKFPPKMRFASTKSLCISNWTHSIFNITFFALDPCYFLLNAFSCIVQLYIQQFNHIILCLLQFEVIDKCRNWILGYLSMILHLQISNINAFLNWKKKETSFDNQNHDWMKRFAAERKFSSKEVHRELKRIRISNSFFILIQFAFKNGIISFGTAQFDGESACSMIIDFNCSFEQFKFIIKRN